MAHCFVFTNYELGSYYAFLETRRFLWAQMAKYSQLIQFSVLHRRIRRACAHAVSEEPPTTIGIETQPRIQYRATIGDFFLLFTIFNNKFCHYRSARIERDCMAYCRLLPIMQRAKCERSR